MAGDETPAYVDDPANWNWYDVNTIANYDPEIIPRVAQYLRLDGRFADTSVWVLGERRLVTLMGCVQSNEQALAMEKAVALVDDVMGVVNQLMVSRGGKPPYPVASPNVK